MSRGAVSITRLVPTSRLLNHGGQGSKRRRIPPLWRPLLRGWRSSFLNTAPPAIWPRVVDSQLYHTPISPADGAPLDASRLTQAHAMVQLTTTKSGLTLRSLR